MKTILTPVMLALGLGFLLLAPQRASGFYNPSTGRWISRDPIGEKGGRNVYAFVRNRPVRSFDGHGRCEASCGEDVTAATDRILSDIQSSYLFMWEVLFPDVPKVSACKWIIGLGPNGIEDAKGAWSIKELAFAGAELPSGLRVGKCRGQPTLTFQNKCHFAGAINYAMFGLIMSLCHDSAQMDPGAFEGISADEWSLPKAQLLVLLWLGWKDHFPPWHEVAIDKVAFTRYGYTRTSPAGGAPQNCGDPSTSATSQGFHWWWHPAKWWDDPD